MFTNEQILSVAREYLQTVIDGNCENAAVCLDENEIHVYHYVNKDFIHITDVTDIGLEGAETVTDTAALIIICRWIKDALKLYGFEVEKALIDPVVLS